MFDVKPGIQPLELIFEHFERPHRDLGQGLKD